MPAAAGGGMQIEANGGSSKQQRLVRSITVVAAGGSAQEPPPQQQGHGAAQEAAAAVSDDEETLDEPESQHTMSLAKHHAAAHLMHQRQHQAAAEMWGQAIQALPDQSELYHDRGVARMELQRHKEAIQDFTVCLNLPDCSPHSRFQSLLFRGNIKQAMGDLGGADSDFKAAIDAADPGSRERKFATDSRSKLVARRVAMKKERLAKEKARQPKVHRYGSTVIEELDPEEGSEEHSEAVTHERVEAWQEAALKLAAEARGQAARLAKQLEAEQQRVQEENQARNDRNAVRAARRRSAAEAAAAAAARRQAEEQQRAQQAQKQPLLLERTRIPIEVVGDAGSSGRSSANSSRSTASRAAGYVSASESGEDEPAAATPADVEEAAAAPAQAEPATGAASMAAAAAGPAAGVPPLLDDVLDALKVDADRAQQYGSADSAEQLYARYLAHRPADLRAWSNRAENCCKAMRWEQALECCNEALAVAAPSHPVPRYKIFARRGAAYHGLGRLQEALRDYEAAEVSAEAEGFDKAKKQIAKRMGDLLAEMEGKGITPVPTDRATLGLGPSAAAPLAATAAGASGEPGVAVAAAAAVTGPAAEAEEDARLASAEAREKGNACFQKKQWEQALRHYQRAGTLDPGCKLALSNQAAALLQLKRWEEAADAASQALAIDSGFPKARHRRAHAYAGAGNPQMALLDMKWVAEALPGDKAVQRDLAEMSKALEEENAAGFLGFDVATNPLFSPPKKPLE